MVLGVVWPCSNDVMKSSGCNAASWLVSLDSIGPNNMLVIETHKFHVLCMCFEKVSPNNSAHRSVCTSPVGSLAPF